MFTNSQRYTLPHNKKTWPLWPCKLLIALILFFSNLSSGSFGEETQETIEKPIKAAITLLNPPIAKEKILNFSLKLSVAPDHKIYQDSMKLEIKPPQEWVKIDQIQYPEPKTFFDPVTKKNKKGFFGDFEILGLIEIIEIPAPKIENIPLVLTYTACTSKYCLLPEELEIPIPVWDSVPQTLTSREKLDRENLWQSILSLIQNPRKSLGNVPQGFLGYLGHWGIMFFIGFLTSLTPCIYPIIPITLKTLSRGSAHSSRKTFLLAQFYVFGLAIIYAFLGVLAAGSGQLFGSFSQSPVILTLVCLVFLILALSSFGFFEISLPASLQVRLASLGGGGGSIINALVMGCVSGLVAGPCVAPVLVGVLAFVSQTGSFLYGFGALFFFALGMGQILLLLSAFTKLFRVLPRSGEWLNVTNKILGLLLLGVFFYYLQFLVSNSVWYVSLGVTSLIFASWLRYLFEKVQHWIRYPLWSFSLALVLMGVVFISYPFIQRAFPNLQAVSNFQIKAQYQNSEWVTYSPDLEAKAKQEKKGLLIDVWAEWCEACKELDTKVLNHPDFLKVTENFIRTKFDATDVKSPQVKTIQERFDIFGLPTVVVIDSQGKHLSDLDLIGNVSLSEAIEKISQVK